jgi:hypothetical protein
MEDGSGSSGGGGGSGSASPLAAPKFLAPGGGGGGGGLEATCFAQVDNLIAQVARLVLAVEADVLAGGESAGEADVVLGLAALGILQTACVAVQLILAAVVGLFGGAGEARAAAERLRMGLPLGGAAEALLVVQLGAGSRLRPPGADGDNNAD